MKRAMAKIYHFRSINAIKEEVPIGNTGKTSVSLTFDETSVEKHEVQLSVKEMLTNRAWKENVGLSFMILIPLYALCYGIMSFGLKIDFNSIAGNWVRIVYFITALPVFIIVWSLLSLPRAVKNIKKDYVDKAREEGSYKIIDEKNWEKFFRLLMLSKKNLKEKELTPR